MLTELPYYTSGKTRFCVYPGLYNIEPSRKIVRILETLIDAEKAEGFLTSEIENGECLSVVSFCREFFPYEDVLLFHVLIEQKQDLFLGTSAILKSFFLICKWTKIYTLVSRHTSEHIETLLMLIDVGFKVCEFSSKSVRNVVVRRDFEKAPVEKFNYDTDIVIKDVYRKTAITNRNANQKSGEKLLTPDAIKLILRWMGAVRGVGIKTIEDLETLVEKQKHIKMQRIGTRNKFIFLIENIETSIGLIFFPKKAVSRRVMLDLFIKLSENQFVETFYTTGTNDIINSVFFLSGYTTASNFLISGKGCLFKWEK